MNLAIAPDISLTRSGSKLMKQFFAPASSSVSFASIVASSPPTYVELKPAAVLPCEALFERLVHDDPSALLQMVREQTLTPSDLTFAAEAAGRITSLDVTPALLTLLRHPSAIVREGVVYGLARHVDKPHVRSALKEVFIQDPSPAVRSAVADALED